MKAKKILLPLLFLASNQAHAEWIRVSPTEIRLNGDIGRDSYEEYLQVADDGFKVVRLNSGGGYPSVALSIAEDVIKRRAIIVIDGVCISACANYLAIAGKVLSMKCDSVIGWHGTLGEVSKERIRMENAGVPSNAVNGYISWLADFKAREQTFFDAAGVDIAILDDSVRVVEESGITPESKFSIDGKTGEYSYTTTTPVWIPTISDMKSYGMNVKSECAQQSDSQIRISLGKAGVFVPFTSNSARAGSKP